MRRYVDVDEVKKRMIPLSFSVQKWISEVDLELIPTADVVEVVRCRDCKHGKMRDYAPPHAPWYCTISVNYHRGDFFCACGERRER